MVTARPILYSPAMVQARHDGRKTQTRRPIKPQPTELPDRFACAWQMQRGKAIYNFTPGQMKRVAPELCPYGRPGDLLWCKESWFAEARFDHLPPREVPKGSPIWYTADGKPPEHAGKRRLGRFMCRWMSRSTDRLTEIQAQRLQDISGKDAEAEGVVYETADPPFYYVPGVLPHSLTAVGVEEPEPRHAERCYFKYWDYLNGDRGVQSQANPWVWVLTYSTELRQVDAVLEDLAA